MNDFLTLALINGIALAFMITPLSCFLVWHKSSFLADTLSHGALLAYVVGILLHIHPWIALIVFSFVILMVIFPFSKKPQFDMGTLFIAFSLTSLSLGLVFVGLFPHLRVDPFAFLFGDLLIATLNDSFMMLGIGAFLWGGIFFFWRSLLLWSLDQDLAHVLGVRLKILQLAFVFCVALVVSLGPHIMGALLLPALMTIPVLTARQFSKTPLQMIFLTFFSTLIGNSLGITLSFLLNTMTSPTIVVVSSGFLLLSMGVNLLITQFKGNKYGI